MDAGLGLSIVEVAYPVIAAAALAAARALGMVMITPAFNRLGLTGMLRSCVAVALSIPMFLPVFTSLSAEPEQGGMFLAGLLVKELLIGLTVGLLFGIPFWAAEVAGELIDLQRGSTMAQLLDPLSSGESGVSATLLTVTLITLFFMSGGFILMVDGYYHSYRFWPVTSFTPVIAAPALEAVLAILDQVMHIGVLLVVPLIIALLVTDLMLAYLARMAPQLNMFDLSLSVKNLIFAVLMVLYAGFLIPLMLDQLSEFRGTVELLKTLAGADG
ncbi:EscT/YscT/HrcT family type III secretion system export apparatus protein [Stutzerimonas nosocomialis]|uniref:EscT/YscT/HrcT family type III secretion system export apparatus protein n=1 Tax=Stutzerimonas nosocomialis TaxID=1056496 RepID=A0A5R9QEY1_9GAMM|nr:type III secretion system export apparatus subunit SctT [Stutzerimonas nosocomialis]TLX63684.1 EscT/YscT/HrcT family type III secretion system export apparatus protein [Stutzerimonas nosocomialis]